ncbi:Succinyl-diaminopimelate desuccinylase [Pseudolycoriella hygida]|uniref:Amino acid transporter n=1 Tax=Pseudolycoriella hygida TaxID=35572 RepID=A0A9Q0N8Q9_9DIPT|nr:Succinyl-diaminopimelate desuccinylase [Pseudolycoriella hygida]
MDGFAINLGLTTIFFAQMMGIDLAFHDYLVIILTSTLGSIGGAGIPGASLIMLPMVLSSVNMPIEGVAMIAGIDRVLDLLRTAINITGDATITLIIDSSEDFGIKMVEDYLPKNWTKLQKEKYQKQLKDLVDQYVSKDLEIEFHVGRGAIYDEVIQYTNVVKDDYQVTNLYGIYGDSKPNICFAGHVDIVPAGDEALWLGDPFIANIVGDKIYGRGTVDMKGAIACFLAASLNFIKLNPNLKGSISFLITSDEEGKAEYGTKEMLKYLYRDTPYPQKLIDLAIVGEPTNYHQIGDTAKIGRRGSINFDLILYGTAGHVAYPSQASNPIPYLIYILNDLVNYRLDEGSEFFQESHLEVTSIDVGNNVTNVIPGKITSKFNIRFNDNHSSYSILKLVEKIIENTCVKYNTEYKLNYVTAAECFIQEPKGLIADFIEVVTDTTQMVTKLSTSGGTSDARFIRNYCPVVEFGLCFSTAHKMNEYTEIRDLQRLYHRTFMSSRLYLIAELMAKPGKEEELFKVLLGLEPLTLREDGCIRYRVTRQIYHPVSTTESKFTIMFNEEWANKTALDTHLEKPYMKEFVDKYIKSPDTSLVSDINIRIFSDEA